MAKKKGDQLRFCCVFRYLNFITVKDAYPIRRIRECLPKLGDGKIFIFMIWGRYFGRCPLGNKRGTKRGLLASWGGSNGRGCPLASATRHPYFSD